MYKRQGVAATPQPHHVTAGTAAAQCVVMHTPAVAGPCHLAVYLRGEAIMGSPFLLEVAPNRVSAEHCLLLPAHHSVSATGAVTGAPRVRVRCPRS